MVILEFLKQPFRVPDFAMAIDLLSMAQSLEAPDSREAQVSIDDLIHKLKKGDLQELAVISTDNVRHLAGGLQTLRQLLVKEMRALMPLRSTLRFEPGELQGSDMKEQVWDKVTSVIQNNPLTVDDMNVVKEVFDQVVAPSLPHADEAPMNDNESTFTIRRGSVLDDAILPIWALLTLYVLAALTFPHVTSSRYPAPWGAPEDPNDASKLGQLGTQHYKPGLGIVDELPRLNELTALVLQDLRPWLEIATAYWEFGPETKNNI